MSKPPKVIYNPQLVKAAKGILQKEKEFREIYSPVGLKNLFPGLGTKKEKK